MTPDVQSFVQSVSAIRDSIPTPTLVMSRSIIEDRAARVGKGIPDCRVYYAMKANDHPGVCRTAARAGLGFEVGSIGEIRCLEQEGLLPSPMITSNPIKSPEFIRCAWDHGIRVFAVDSVAEVEKLAQEVPDAEFVIRLAVSNAESDWPLSGKFGIEVGAARELLVTAKRLGLRCSGATFHVGSQCTNARAWIPAIDLARVLFRMGEEIGHPMDLLNLGGGYPATYLRRVPSARQIEATVAPYLQEHFPPRTRFFVEPGRYLVGDAGILVTRVIGKAWRSDGRLWVYLDIGVFNGLAEALGGIRYPILTGREGPLRPVTLAGVSCDGFDIIDTRAEHPEPEIGDRWLLLTAGAYTTVYAARFNGLDLPNVAFIEDMTGSRLL